MQIVKSIFVTLYMIAVVAIAQVATQSLLQSRDYLSWGGVLLVTVPFVIIIARLMFFRNVPRTSSRLPLVTVLATAGVILSFWGYTRGGSSEAPLLAFAGWTGFILYAYWYSSFGRQPSAQLRVGSTLPSFELRDVDGQTVTSSSFSDKPTIWIFYRGNWCPLCMAQIKELVAQYKELQSLGVRIALISPQPHKYTIALAKKFDVPFDFLTDKGNRAARALGIDHSHGLPLGMQMFGYSNETVLPTVIITDAGGRVLWAHETDNYRVRPEPDVYLAVLRGD